MITAYDFLRKQGNDVEFATAVVNGGNAVIVGQTVSIAVSQRQSAGVWKWWNTGTNAFDLGAEPGLMSTSQDGTTGVYRKTLTGGNDNTKINYQVHVVAAGVVAYNFYIDLQINLDELVPGISDFMRSQGFRREKISRETLLKQNNQTLIEIRNIKRKLETQKSWEGDNARRDKF